MLYGASNHHQVILQTALSILFCMRSLPGDLLLRKFRMPSSISSCSWVGNTKFDISISYRFLPWCEDKNIFKYAQLSDSLVVDGYFFLPSLYLRSFLIATDISLFGLCVSRRSVLLANCLQKLQFSISKPFLIIRNSSFSTFNPDTLSLIIAIISALHFW